MAAPAKAKGAAAPARVAPAPGYRRPRRPGVRRQRRHAHARRQPTQCPRGRLHPGKRSQERQAAQDLDPELPNQGHRCHDRASSTRRRASDAAWPRRPLQHAHGRARHTRDLEGKALQGQRRLSAPSPRTAESQARGHLQNRRRHELLDVRHALFQIALAGPARSNRVEGRLAIGGRPSTCARTCARLLPSRAVSSSGRAPDF